MRLLLSLLLATAAFAQIPADTLRTKLYERLTAYRQFLQENPGAIEERRLEGAIHLRLGSGRLRALFGRGLAHVDPDTHEIVPTDLDLYETDQGWRTVGSPVVVRVIPGPLVNGSETTEVQTYRKDPNDGTVTGYGIVMAPVTYYQDLAFRFTQQGVPWQITLTEYGWDLQARVTAEQGAKLYQFGYREVGMTLAPDADGNLATANGKYTISRPVMVRADGIETQCGPWQRDASHVGFVCDDSTFPAEAFPYVIDPSASFDVNAGADDGRIVFTYEPAPPTAVACAGYWPPNSFISVITNAVTLPAGGHSYYNYDGPHTECWEYESFLRFDTSTLPANAVVTSASLTVYVTSAMAESSAYEVYAEYYASANWPLDQTDFATWPASATAFTASILGFTENANNTIALSNVGSIVKGGLTGFRLWEPTAPGYPGASGTRDVLVFNSSEAASNQPSLQVDYELSRPKLIWINQ